MGLGNEWNFVRKMWKVIIWKVGIIIDVLSTHINLGMEDNLAQKQIWLGRLEKYLYQIYCPLAHTINIFFI
jgi:phage-related holin